MPGHDYMRESFSVATGLDTYNQKRFRIRMPEKSESEIITVFLPTEEEARKHLLETYPGIAIMETLEDGPVR
jgi:hypothetical protein